jgi:hypothetical protein
MNVQKTVLDIAVRSYDILFISIRVLPEKPVLRRDYAAPVVLEKTVDR